MKQKWVFEKDAYIDGNTELMMGYCRSRGIPYQLVDYVAFGQREHIRWEYGSEECVIVYGTIHLVQFVQKKKAWYPGAWCDWHKLKCTTYLSHWGQFSLQEDYMFVPIAELYRRWNTLWFHYARDGHVFIKPDDNDKRFHGEKVAGEFRDRWYETAQIYGAPPESLALISRPSRVNAEWRFVIADKKIVTGSLYRVGGRLGSSRVDPDWQFDRGAMEFAEEVVNATEWQPAPIYTLDVCMVEGEKYKLMEVGSLNCAGLYKCDVEKIIVAANEIALKEWNETHDILY